MSGRWRLTVEDEFSAAHALRNYRGKCEKLHGHNFNVSICVDGSRLDENTFILVDFSILKKELREILAGLDHADLSGLPEFAATNPSSECLAQYVGARMQEFLHEYSLKEGRQVRLVSVSVSEKARQTATWLAPDMD